MKKFFALALALLAFGANRAMAAVDSTAFVAMREDASDMAGYAQNALIPVLMIILGIAGILFAWKKIQARLGR